jgi:hypothetical protein
MAWTDVNFDEVNPGQELIPEGDYTFLVISASRGKYDQDEVSVRVNVATPGPFQGVTVYLRYPNPAKADKNQPADSPHNWVVKSFKLFLEAVKPFGYTMAKGETPVEFINRIANDADRKNEQIMFDARVGHETYADRETGEPITRHKIAFRSVKACERG